MKRYYEKKRTETTEKKKGLYRDKTLSPSPVRMRLQKAPRAEKSRSRKPQKKRQQKKKKRGEIRLSEKESENGTR